MIEDIIKALSNYVGNERLYNKAVIPALITEIISRATGDKNWMEISKKLYRISRNVRAIEELIYVYGQTGDLNKAIKRAMYKLEPRYVGQKRRK